jgi:hypothetical protein
MKFIEAENGIDTNVPVPEQWPFSRLQPGNSFKVADVMEDYLRRRRARANVWAGAKRYMQKHPGITLIVRNDRDHNIRCWRTE